MKPVFTATYLHLSPLFFVEPDGILWLAMDSPEAEWLSEILRTQEARLIHQEEFQSTMDVNMGNLSSQLQDLMGQLARPGAATSTPTVTTAPVTTTHTGGAACKLAPRLCTLGTLGFVKLF